MVGCVGHGQQPTKLGTSFVRYLSEGKLAVKWRNIEADSVYRSRRISAGRPSSSAVDTALNKAQASSRSSRVEEKKPAKKKAQPAKKKRSTQRLSAAKSRAKTA
jgi:hypothetical protein